MAVDLSAVEGSAVRAGDIAHKRPTDLRVIVCLSFRRGAGPEAIARFKASLIAQPCVLHALEANGAFDFMVEIAVPDVPSYGDWLEGIAAHLSLLVERYETNFVSDRFIRQSGAEKAIWIPCKDGARRLRSSAIDKVIAEGDYMRVHSRGSSWLVHATMRSFVDRLADAGFVQIHRSALVRRDFIDGLAHDDGHWRVQLADGTSERVARSHVADMLRQCHL